MRRNEIVNFVRGITNGKFIHIEFVKANGELRNATVQFGVQHPTNVTAPGQGVRKGRSFDEAVADGTLVFFEANKVNPNGTRGAYRSAKLDRILSITANGVKYEIEDNADIRREIR